ncbi:MAG: aldo/keto reductase [Treponema sp.]|nr:aldo/keto reductase [Treponema sp.]
MKKLPLGKSGLKVSQLCIGCWSFGGDSKSYWGEQNQADVDALVNEALDRGINFFDTAFGYNSGESEKSLGKALKKRRGEAVICNKIPIQEGDALKNYEAVLGDSLKRLGTDYMDILMIHWPVKDESLLRKNFEALLKAREKGIIREIGVSNFGLSTLKIARDMGVAVIANEFAYNLISRGMEKAILPYCIKNNIGVLAYMPLMQGVLAGKYRTVADIPLMRRRTIHYSKSGNPNSLHNAPGADAEVEQFLDGLRELSAKTGIPCGTLSVAWLSQKQGVTSIIAGSRNREQVLENEQAVSTTLDAGTIKALDDLSKPLFNKLGNYLDLWKSVEESRIW